MADKGTNVKGGEASTGSSSTKKLEGMFPKERKHVSQMVGEKISEAISSGVKNIKHKLKIKPDGGGS